MIKLRLTALNFLEFAVWGAYLTCMSQYLNKAGMGGEVPMFYSLQGIVSIFMPTLMGIVADRWVQPQRLLGLCHLVAGCCMVGIFLLGEQSAEPNKALFMSVYAVSVGFFMPTLGLSNTVAFTTLKNQGLDTVKDFPVIRVFGTVGFIASMWFVNCAAWDGSSFAFTFEENGYKFMYTHYQFLVSGVLSIILCVYCFTMPQCKIVAHEAASLFESLGLGAFRLFKTKKMAIFFVFSALLGMALQVTNTYASPFISSFKDVEKYADSFCANNSVVLVSLSQISETFCILLIPFFLKRFGIKIVMLIAMLAWVFRFGFFGLGTPDFPGVILFILSCIVYGVAFDFFNVSGGLFVDQECDSSMKASAQGLFMLMTNGIGASVGTYIAGKIVALNCPSPDVDFNMVDWPTCWFIFAGYALVIAVLFAIFFRYKHNPSK